MSDPFGFVFYGLTKSPGAILDAERVRVRRARTGPSKARLRRFQQSRLSNT